MDIAALVNQLTSSVGDLWLAALFGQFFVMVCESAKPKREEGEPREETQGFALLVMILSMLTPFLLFLHAFLSGSGGVLAIIIAIVGAVVTAALIGWLIATVAPDVGRRLNRITPFLALPVFALALYVSWETVFGLVNSFVTARASR